MEQDIIDILKVLCEGLNEVKKYVVEDNKKISKVYNKLKTQDDLDTNIEEAELVDKSIYKNKYESMNLNDYTKIILKDFESRISILEEENQTYKRM